MIVTLKNTDPAGIANLCIACNRETYAGSIVLVNGSDATAFGMSDHMAIIAPLCVKCRSTDDNRLLLNHAKDAFRRGAELEAGIESLA